MPPWSRTCPNILRFLIIHSKSLLAARWLSRIVQGLSPFYIIVVLHRGTLLRILFVSARRHLCCYRTVFFARARSHPGPHQIRWLSADAYLFDIFFFSSFIGLLQLLYGCNRGHHTVFLIYPACTLQCLVLILYCHMTPKQSITLGVLYCGRWLYICLNILPSQNLSEKFLTFVISADSIIHVGCN